MPALSFRRLTDEKLPLFSEGVEHEKKIVVIPVGVDLRLASVESIGQASVRFFPVYEAAFLIEPGNIGDTVPVPVFTAVKLGTVKGGMILAEGYQ